MNTTVETPDENGDNVPQINPTGVVKHSNEPSKIQLMDQNLVSGDLETAMLRAEKYLAIQDRVRKLAVNLTNERDWVNEGGNPYLQWTGTSKVAMAFGVSYEQLTYNEKRVEDDKGNYVTFECTGFVTWQGRRVPETGTGSSRDPFFGKKQGEFLPTSEVDLNNIRKKALTNFLNRGLKSMIGLSFTWEEIEKTTNNRINRGNVMGVKYDKGSSGGAEKDTPELLAKRKQFGEMILTICNGNKNAAGDYLEQITSWTDKKTNKVIKGKRTVKYLSEKQLDFLWSGIQEQSKQVVVDKEPPLGEDLPVISRDEPLKPLSDVPKKERSTEPDKNPDDLDY